jgi:membrane protease YdiL (CAAX protease family)
LDKPFPIKGRYLVAIWLLPLVYFPGLDLIYSLLGEDVEWFWYLNAFYIYHHAVYSLLLAGLVLYHNVDWRKMLSAPDRQAYPPAFKLTAFIFVFSIAAAYGLFYPLSFVAPGFVTFWYIDLPPLIFSAEGAFPFIPNLLGFLSLVIFAPVIEEFIFRGLLLHRWGDKWGLNRAIILSSLLFGIVHPDPIGAVAFGVAMSVLYLKTQTLIVPMVCHAAYNFVCWLLEIGYIATNGMDYVYTLDEFRSEWAIGLICGLISMVWVYAYLNGERDTRPMELPNI